MFNFFKKKKDEDDWILIYNADGIGLGGKLYQNVEIYISSDGNRVHGRSNHGEMSYLLIKMILENELSFIDSKHSIERNKLTTVISVIDRM